ncbi:MAG: HsdM family class I SAM-dependent methyltransferase [Planctomycetota bacterium]|jgi:hypothetical protein
MEQVLDQLGYSQSPQFLQGRELEAVDGYAHIFRRALTKYGLHGVYVLRPSDTETRGITPLVYVCEAQNEEQAREIHQNVWNQNVVPFLLVKSPRYVRLYKGFSYDHDDRSPDADTFKSVSLEPDRLFGTVNRVLDLMISADDIESGKIWEKWGKEIKPDQRVDRTLLEELEKLGRWLTSHNVDIHTAHALIGKFVYLRYLRDRQILSDRKLQNWNIDPRQVFTRNATLAAFWSVNDKLDDWLNGAVFPLPRNNMKFRADHVKKVAGIFFGDQIDGQLHLDFQAYDFSAIPAETLSSIYEQFLHVTDPSMPVSRGEKAGAYYTPVPLANFTVNELEKHRPLEEGMKTLDASCGSGTFLVQCYRRLIERKRSQGINLTPHRLKTLLVNHIYGVELYEDACQVTALSLILALLDNVTPPDLEIKQHEKFELPNLLGNNIFHADFFDPDSPWTKKAKNFKFDWIIGNPPWKEVETDSTELGDEYAWQWMASPENKDHPATDNQLAEAFAWKVRDHLKEDGVVGLVLPAMTFTKQDSRFRKAFFSENRVYTVINFANLRHILFQKKKGEGASASSPAAVICFQKGAPESGNTILSYAPFVIDQVANRPITQRKKVPVWSITVNSSDLQELSANDVRDGSHLHWKVAMWGTPRDMQLLRRLQGKFETFEEFCQRNGLITHEGFQLRKKKAQKEKNKKQEKLDYMPELVGKKKLIFKKLRGCGRIFEFPSDAIGEISKSECYVRKGRGELPYKISKPPHIILDAARRFAIYSDEFLAIPGRQIGISGRNDKMLLKALAAYLNSHFVVYHEFLDTSEWGIKSDRATIQSLRRLPVPEVLSTPKMIKTWASLYDRIRKSSGDRKMILLDELNSYVFDTLDLRKSERILIDDMVNHRLQLLDGKVPKKLLGAPSHEQIQSYLHEFKQVLDVFVGKTYKHEVVAKICGKVALLQTRLFTGAGNIPPQIIKGHSELADTLEDTFDRLRQQHSQWLYFNRCLKVYNGSCMYILKPLQMSQWTRSKALCDADDVIGEYLVTQG